jgi:hypothetical protein
VTASRRALAALAAALLAALAAAAPAGAALRPLGTFASPMTTDGERYAVAQLQDGATRIIDTRRRTSSRFQPPAGFTIVGVGGGQLAWQCTGCMPDPSSFEAYLEARVLTIATGTLAAPDPLVVLKGEPESFLAVGKHWLYALRYSYHSETPSWYGWRTSQGHGERDDRHAMDLDRAGLGPELCAPLRRERYEGPDYATEYHQNYVDYAYEPPYGLWRSNDGELRLDRCGRKRSLTIGRVRVRRERQTGEQLGEGIVSWFDRGAARLYAVRTGRRHSWDVPSSATKVQHTRSRVYVSVFDNGSWRVLTARIPKRLRK